MSDSFAALSQQTGIALPPTLTALIAQGRTSNDDPALKALDALNDFRWLSPQRAGETIAEWLNPVKQGGNVFLPFGRSGAGDAYCLVRLASGEQGVCMVWHDSAESTLHHAGFDEFILAGYLEVMAELDLLAYHDYADIAAAVRADIDKVIALLAPASQQVLRSIMAGPVIERVIPAVGRMRARTVRSWIHEEHDHLVERADRVEPTRFAVVVRWEE